MVVPFNDAAPSSLATTTRLWSSNGLPITFKVYFPVLNPFQRERPRISLFFIDRGVSNRLRTAPWPLGG